jgi:hypothetical protein
MRTSVLTLVVVASLALSSHARSPQPQPATAPPAETLLVWSFDAGRGVVGDAKTGLIYAASRRGAEIIESDLAGTIQRRIRLRPTTGLSTGILRLARFSGGTQPILLAFSTWSSNVQAFALDGTQLWSYPGPAEPAGIDDVSVVDLNGDGTDEVIVGFNGATGVRVIDSKGQLAWQSTTIGNVWHVSGGDVLGTGGGQVVTTSAKGMVHVFSANGVERTDIQPAFYANMVRTGMIPETARAATVVAGGMTRDITALAAFSGRGVMQWSLQLPTSEPGVRAAWLAPTKPWLAVHVRDGAVHVIDVERGVVISSLKSQGPIVEVGWSRPESDGSPLLLVSDGGQLRAYRILARSR